MTMTWMDFTIRLLIALVLGTAIGIERQWLKRRAVLKINVLVCLGAAMYVMMASMVPNDSSPTRVAAQIVSGIGFLGGGVIFREGTTVRGLNTAATIWCAAAIGALIGYGLIFQAYAGVLAIVGANLLFRPLVPIFQKSRESIKELSSENQTQNYHLRVIANLTDETRVRELLLEPVKNKKLILNSIHSKNLDSDRPDGEITVEIKLDFSSQGRNDLLIEELVSNLKATIRVSEVSWEFLTLVKR
jgi:putative Mg2+ transporter-C (MgtC) family protein